MKVYLVSWFRFDQLMFDPATKTFRTLESAKQYVQAEWGSEGLTEEAGSATVNYYFDDNEDDSQGIGIWELEVEES